MRPQTLKKGESASATARKYRGGIYRGRFDGGSRRGENGYIFLMVKNESASPERLAGGDVDAAKRARIVQFKKHGPQLRPVIIAPVPVEGHET